MVELKVSSNDFDCDLILERRVTYIRGDSGTGKTGVVDKINAYTEGDTSVSVVCSDGRRAVVLNTITSPTMLDAYKKYVVFFDDLIVTESELFNSTIIKSAIENDVYLVVINRVDSDIKPVSLRVNFSISSILISHCEGKRHWFTKQVEDLGSVDFGFVKYDCVVAEDKFGSKNFSKSVFNLPVFCAEGGDNIIRETRNAISKGYKSIFVFLDSAEFGKNFHDFKSVFEDEDEVSIYFDYHYECFEYLLLVSNMLNKEFEFDEVECNMFSSWEAYFESEIERITDSKMYAYHHGSKVKGCYTHDCNKVCNTFKSSKCDKYVNSDKILHMFKGTIFEYLIGMRNNHRKLKPTKEDNVHD